MNNYSIENRDDNDKITWMVAVQIFTITFLGAGIAAAIAIPVTRTLINPSLETTTSTLTTTSTTTSTTTTVTTTTSTSTTSTTVTTTTTTTTTSTATTITTTTTIAASCTFPCQCSGVSSNTLWQIYNADTITMPISTSSCNFTRTPVYFTSVSGTSSHWTTISYNAIFSPTSNSLVVYLRAFSGTGSSTLLSWAGSYSWDVNWFGIYN